MAIQKIKSLFYESPTPPKVVKAVVQPSKVKQSTLKERVISIINEGVMFGQGPILYGSSPADSRLKIGQAKGGGGGYAGPIAVAKQPGETQFGIIEEEGEDMNLDAASDELSKAEPAEETPPSEDTSEADSKDSPEEQEAPPIDTTPDEAPEAPPVPEETPEQKVTKMFADTGDIDEDYSLSNENNIRLEKFKFVNAGIDLKKLIPEDDQKSGISTKDVMNLLTPSQRDMLKNKNRELRKKYALMDKREKNIIVHNSNVPISSIQNGQTVEISTDMKKQAYDKINAYLETNFGKNWQDKSKAIEFLRTIKINFSESPAIRANLIDVASMISEEGENYKLPLDKINVMVPSVVQDFIKTNKEDPTFARSNIFRTITSAYNQEAGTKGQIYVIFNSANLGDGEQETPNDSGDESKDNAEAPETEVPVEEPAGEEAPSENSDDLSGALENAVEPLPSE